MKNSPLNTALNTFLVIFSLGNITAFPALADTTAEATVSPEVLKRFKSYDKDNNGIIYQGEFLAGNPPTEMNFAARVFTFVLDTNQDQKVLLSEYQAFRQKNEYDITFGAYDTENAQGEPGPDGFWNTKEFAQAYDLDRDGNVSEFQIKAAEVKIKSGRKPIDANKDGLVSKAEYTAFQK